jgi:hypothetical protein
VDERLPAGTVTGPRYCREVDDGVRVHIETEFPDWALFGYVRREVLHCLVRRTLRFPQVETDNLVLPGQFLDGPPPECPECTGDEDSSHTCQSIA